MPSLIVAALICSATWLLWRTFRNYVVKSPLDRIPGPAPTSFWKGNFGQLFHRHDGWEFHSELSEKYDPVVKMYGLFGRRLLYVFDPKALHSIIVKDQNVYEETPSFFATNSLVFGPGLLVTQGHHHRKQRKMLNPVFSVAHMKHMTPIFYQVTHRLKAAITSQVKNGPKEIDILNWMGRTALELIGQGGLGYSFDPLVEEVHDSFGEAMKNLLPTLFTLSITRQFIEFLVRLGPPSFRRKLVDIFPNSNVQKLKTLVDTLDSRSRQIFAAKKAALLAGNEAVVKQVGEGKDLMSILLKANLEASEKDQLNEEELIGQMSTLVFAATDTTSSALAHILHLLALHPEVQQKLRKEISEARDGHGQDMPYEQLVELPYMDAVCRETLRLYPPVTSLERVATEDIVMPLHQPIHAVDGSLIHEIPIPKDTYIFIGIRACNRNKAIWGEDALEWKPERWLGPLPNSVTDAHIPGVYSNLMTFIGGGRSCIGFKFSQLEMKVVLSILLESFQFSLPSKEIIWNLAPVKYPTVGPNATKPSMPMKVTLLK